MFFHLINHFKNSLASILKEVIAWWHCVYLQKCSSIFIDMTHFVQYRPETTATHHVRAYLLC